MADLRKDYEKKLDKQGAEYAKKEATWMKQKQVLMNEATKDDAEDKKRDNQLQLLEKLVLHLHGRLTGNSAATKPAEADKLVNSLLQHYKKALEAEAETQTAEQQTPAKPVETMENLKSGPRKVMDSSNI